MNKKIINVLKISFILAVLVRLQVTFSRYTQFGTKLSPIFGFAKSSQIQNHLSINPIAQIRCSGCWWLECVLRCLRIRRYKSSLKRQHNFIRDDRLYEGSETSHAKKRGGLTKDYEKRTGLSDRTFRSCFQTALRCWFKENWYWASRSKQCQRLYVE